MKKLSFFLLSSVLFFACSDDSSSGASHIDEQETPTCVDEADCDSDLLPGSSDAKDSSDIELSSSSSKNDSTEVKPDDKDKLAYCGTETYDPAEKFCYGIKLYDLCEDKAYDVEKEFCSENSIYALCGGKSYDLETEFCSDDLIYELCDGESYNPKDEFCANDLVYTLCDGKTYDPTVQECVSDKSVSSCNITYGDSKACLPTDSLYVLNKQGDTIAVDIGIEADTTGTGKRTYIATSNLIVKQNGSAYIPASSIYIPSDRYYTESATESDLFGYADVNYPFL